MAEYDDMFVTAADLAPFTSSTDFDRTIDLVNQLVGEAWKNPVEPVPAHIKVIALDVATRALGNPQGVESTTKSSDQTSKTVRFVSSRTETERRLYLTDEEARVLAGLPRRRSTVGSINTFPR